ncbi:hypothetical protein [Streptomyces sp. NPDC005322]
MKTCRTVFRVLSGCGGNLYATAAYTAAQQGDRHTTHALPWE